jgi:carbamoyl-phosphate synthase large subunit
MPDWTWSELRARLGRVLVTGVGGAAGFGLARTMLQHGFEVTGVDADPMAAGLRLPGIQAHVLPDATDAGYEAQFIEVLDSTGSSTLVPTLDEELIGLIRLGDTLEAKHIRRWLPSEETVRHCWDKLRFAEIMTGAGIPTPRTCLPADLPAMTENQALVIKPRSGRGSRDVYFCTGTAQAALACDMVPNAIVQDRIQGREFTADCLADRAGRCACVLRLRDRVRGGLSMAGTTFIDSVVSGTVEAAVRAVGVEGPCCVQGFLTGKHGDPVFITEINTRFAGGHTLSDAAGGHLTSRYLTALAGLLVSYDVTYDAGVSMTRYVSEFFWQSPAEISMQS